MGSRYTLDITIPSLPPMNTAANRRNRFTQAREADTWRRAVVIAVGSRRPTVPLPLSRLTLTRASSVEPDYDNLVISFKAVIDALMPSSLNRRGKWIDRACVIEDDSPRHVIRDYKWVKAAPGNGFVRVQVEQLKAPHGLDCAS